MRPERVDHFRRSEEVNDRVRRQSRRDRPSREMIEVAVRREGSLDSAHSPGCGLERAKELRRDGRCAIELRPVQPVDYDATISHLEQHAHVREVRDLESRCALSLDGREADGGGNGAGECSHHLSVGSATVLA